MDDITFGMPVLLELDGLQAQVELCRSLELDFIELNMNLPEYDLSGVLRDRITRLREETGTQFTLHLPEEVDLASFQREIRDGFLLLCKNAVTWASETGIPLVNLHLNPGVYFTLPDRTVQLYDKYYDRFLSNLEASFSELNDLAGRAGVLICIENANSFHLPFIKQALAVLLESDNVFLTWDTGHDAKSGFQETPVIFRYADRVRHVHLHDFRDNADHQPLFTGSVDIRAALNLARENRCRVVVETKTEAALRESISNLRKYLP